MRKVGLTTGKPDYPKTNHVNSVRGFYLIHSFKATLKGSTNELIVELPPFNWLIWVIEKSANKRRSTA